MVGSGDSIKDKLVFPRLEFSQVPLHPPYAGSRGDAGDEEKIKGLFLRTPRLRVRIFIYLQSNQGSRRGATGPMKSHPVLGSDSYAHAQV